MDSRKITEEVSQRLAEKLQKTQGLKAGDQVNFVMNGEKVALIHSSRSSISAVRGILRSEKVVTVEEMDAAIQKLHSKHSDGLG